MDHHHLVAVYASTRADELDQFGWDETQRAAFVLMQFTAQDRHYRQHFPDAAFQVIEVTGRRAGRLIVARGADDIRIVDIALLAAYRGRGVGTALLVMILAEGAATQRRVSVHVERANRARSLYQRLGFVTVSDRDPYLLLEWASSQTGQPNAAS